jgi:cell wall-associated NlpC family hydrolase
MARKACVVFVVALLISAMGCASSKPPVTGRHIPPPRPDKKDSTPANPAIQTLPDKRKIIIRQAVINLGAPYKWGGKSPRTGFDCSGLALYSHQQADISIPRTAVNQFLNGRPVSKKDLLPGDLVFFDILKSSKTIHVGIYIGERLFVHAPGKGRQVTRADLNNPYFKKTYKGSRRYL